VDAAALVTGKVYFAIWYEDEEMTRMIIQSYEYLGPATDDQRQGGPWYRFRALDPLGDSEDDQRNVGGSPYDGEFRLTTENVLSLMDLDGLIDGLQRIKRNGPGRMWADAS
jgi:hypothetical protein